jgi:hypothetical protein
MYTRQYIGEDILPNLHNKETSVKTLYNIYIQGDVDDDILIHLYTHTKDDA